MKRSLVLHDEDETFHIMILRWSLNVKTGGLCEEGKPLGECLFNWFCISTMFVVL